MARTNEQLAKDLAAQLRFLRRSAAAYDAGDEDEAIRIAGVLRTLLHDSKAGVSVLTQLQLMPVLAFLDSAAPFDPRNLIATIGLVQMTMSVGAGPMSATARYVAPLGELTPDRQAQRPFNLWWTRPVARASPNRPDAEPVSRRSLVLGVANREGGAHLDPLHDPIYQTIGMENAFGFVFKVGEDGAEQPVGGNAVAASIRQIGYEVDATLSDQLPKLLPEFFQPVEDGQAPVRGETGEPEPGHGDGEPSGGL